MHLKEGSVIKRHKVLIDGEALEEVDFVEKVASSLGDFATTNQFSVRNLKERLKQKDLQISQLHNQMKTVENNVWSAVNKGFKNIRANDK